MNLLDVNIVSLIEKESNMSFDWFSNKPQPTAYEFYGDRWHGNPYVKHDDIQQAQNRYNKTIGRGQIIRLLGLKLITIWESDWKTEINNFQTEYRYEITNHVEHNYIDPRTALHGGRTEPLKTYYECDEGEFIYGYGLSSQYPAVMA